MTALPHTRRLREQSDRALSSLGESFVGAARAFDPGTLGDSLLFPLELTWFHGEPVYESLPPDARRKLNHLTFCHYYFLTLNAEASANILNHQSAFQMLRSDPDAAFYMAREAVEESFHVEAFHILIQKVLGHYGLSVRDFLWGESSVGLTAWFYRIHTLAAWWRGNLDAYYFSRYPLNIGTKIAERSILKEPRLHPEVRAIVRGHSIDEARHMQMSRETGKRALARMSAPGRAVACFLYAQFVTRLNICGRQVDRRFPVKMLERCGVPRGDAERAYREWRERVHQPQDPPDVRAMRRYFVRQNLEFVGELEASPRLRAYVTRAILRAYPDVAEGPQALAG